MKTENASISDTTYWILRQSGTLRRKTTLESLFRDLKNPSEPIRKVAINALIIWHAPLAYKLAKDLGARTIPCEERFAIALLALSQAVNNFNPQHPHASLPNCAKLRIRRDLFEASQRDYIVSHVTTSADRTAEYHLTSALKALGLTDLTSLTDGNAERIVNHINAGIHCEQNKTTRPSVQNTFTQRTALPVSLDMSTDDEDARGLENTIPSPWESPEQIAAREQEEDFAHNALEQAMAHLTQQERTVLAGQYLGDEKIPMNVLGAQFGVSASRVCQIKKEALRKLRNLLQTNGVKESDLFSEDDPFFPQPAINSP